MCELAATSLVTRSAVLKHRGIEFYLGLLLEKTSFVTDALEAIAVWYFKQKIKSIKSIQFNQIKSN